MACVKQSDTRSDCKVIDANGTVTDHIFQYNQAYGNYKFGDLYIDTPSIAYNGTYQLMIEPSNPKVLGSVMFSKGIFGLNYDINYPDTRSTFTLIEQGYYNIV